LGFHSKEKFLENKPAGYDGVFDWDFFIPVFKGTKIKPMDIDGCIERKGNALLFETKKPGVSISKGQIITLEFFVKIGVGKITIFHIAEDFSLFGEWHNLNGTIGY